MRTLHPDFEALSYRWLREKDVKRDAFERTDEAPADWQASPLSYLFDNDLAGLRRRFVGPDAKVVFALLESF